MTKYTPITINALEQNCGYKQSERRAEGMAIMARCPESVPEEGPVADRGAADGLA